MHDIPQEMLVPLRLGNPSELEIGDQVAATGNPFGISGVLTEGISLANASSDTMTDIATAESNSTGIVIVVKLALCILLSGFRRWIIRVR